MTQIEHARYEMRKVADLVHWEDNPSTATAEDLERLEKQIYSIGVYKPLVINQNNTVLGGNKRLRILTKLGVKEVMCAVMLTDNRAQMIEIGLSDNDMVGITSEEKVAELVVTVPDVRSEIFAIHSNPAKLVSKIRAKVTPEPDNSKEPGCRRCPLHCELEE